MDYERHPSYGQFVGVTIVAIVALVLAAFAYVYTAILKQKLYEALPANPEVSSLYESLNKASGVQVADSPIPESVVISWYLPASVGTVLILSVSLFNKTAGVRLGSYPFLSQKNRLYLTVPLASGVVTVDSQNNYVLNPNWESFITYKTLVAPNPSLAKPLPKP
jgi:hypothetical protein